MVQLQGDLERIEGAGVRVVAISYDPVEVLGKFAATQKVTFPLLSDPGSKTIRAYGVLNEQTEGLPHPGTFLLDRGGDLGPRGGQQGGGQAQRSGKPHGPVLRWGRAARGLRDRREIHQQP